MSRKYTAGTTFDYLFSRSQHHSALKLLATSGLRSQLVLNLNIALNITVIQNYEIQSSQNLDAFQLSGCLLFKLLDFLERGT